MAAPSPRKAPHAGAGDVGALCSGPVHRGRRGPKRAGGTLADLHVVLAQTGLLAGNWGMDWVEHQTGLDQLGWMGLVLKWG